MCSLQANCEYINKVNQSPIFSETLKSNRDIFLSSAEISNIDWSVTWHLHLNETCLELFMKRCSPEGPAPADQHPLRWMGRDSSRWPRWIMCPHHHLWSLSCKAQINANTLYLINAVKHVSSSTSVLKTVWCDAVQISLVNVIRW